MVARSTNRRRKPTRPKLSTTVAEHTFAYLNELIRRGEADNLAEALDLVVDRLREQEARVRLDAEIAAYYDSLTDEELEEDRLWGEFATREFGEIEK